MGSQPALPQFSEDGRWWWTGAEWVPAEQGPMPSSHTSEGAEPAIGKGSATTESAPVAGMPVTNRQDDQIHTERQDVIVTQRPVGADARSRGPRLGANQQARPPETAPSRYSPADRESASWVPMQPGATAPVESARTREVTIWTSQMRSGGLPPICMKTRAADG